MTNFALKEEFRHLMRDCAQPVAVVSTFLHDPSRSPLQTGTKEDDLTRLHGATISSFASISMEPYPMISFALQLPSRLAASLSLSSQENVTPKAHCVLNVLSSSQVDIARRFSRPDVYPHPFVGLSGTDEEKLSSQWRMTADGLPMLLGSLHCISCSIVQSHPLDIGIGNEALIEKEELEEERKRTSKIFLARVIRVEDMTGEASQSSDHQWQLNEFYTRKPLIYHKKAFTTVK